MTNIDNRQETIALNMSMDLNAIFPSDSSSNADHMTLAMIRTYAFNFEVGADVGQTLSIAQHTALFALLGTTYGGDGRSTYVLPDLEDVIGIGAGTNPFLPPVTIGQEIGVNDLALTQDQFPTELRGSGDDIDNHQASLPIKYLINILDNGPLGTTAMGFLGQIVPFASPSSFSVPGGWVEAKGQFLNIADHPDLFATIGTTYGGDGTTIFALPDLRGRTPVGASNEAGELRLGQANFFNDTQQLEIDQFPVSLGGSADPFDNIQPSLGINYAIATEGTYPSRDISGGFEDEAFLGEIVAFAGTTPPDGYTMAHGQILSIAENSALFSLLGTTYGGDGQTTFQLPDLRGRAVTDESADHRLGDVEGANDGTVPDGIEDGIISLSQPTISILGESGEEDTDIPLFITFSDGEFIEGLGTFSATVFAEDGVLVLPDPLPGDDPLPFDLVAVAGLGTGTVTIASSALDDDGNLLVNVISNLLMLRPDSDFNGDQDITVTANDGGFLGNGTSADVMTTSQITVTPVQDSAVAIDDAFSTDEATVLNGASSLFDPNPAGGLADFDAEGDPFFITKINGDASRIGTQITLPSGALLRVNDTTGVINYDPNGAFNSLPGAGSGAANTQVIDSFTYEVTGGSTATVSITVNGLDSNDFLLGTAGANVLLGGDFNDVLRGGGLGDILFGGSGNDYADYRTSAQGVTVNLLTGFVSGGDAAGDNLESIERLYGSNEADDLTGDGKKNVLRGEDGDDILNGGDKSDVLRGGAGGDTLNGDAGSDWADYRGSPIGVTVNLDTGVHSGGHAAGDTLNSIENLIGSDGDDMLTGDGGRNILRGGLGVDTLNGLGDNDILRGGADGDILNGGAGFDFADYRNSATGVTVNLLTNVHSGGDAAGDSLTSIERVYGSNDADTLTGDGGKNTLRGEDGNDILNGGGDNDVLQGGKGLDTLNGDAGSDWAYYGGSGVGVTVNLDTGVHSGGDAAGDTLNSIENLIGSNKSDDLTGDSGSNVLRGRDGGDTLNGLGDNDVLRGESGNDILDGGGGEDVLRGGADNDILTGGLDADIFDFDTASFGQDTVTDWQDGLDMFDFSDSSLTFAQLTIAQSGTDTTITNSLDTANVVTVLNTNAALIDEFDFL